MEAIMVPYSPDQSISPYNNNKNNMRNPNRMRNSRHFVSRSIENFAPRKAINNHNGLLFAPYSFPAPTISLVNPNQPQHHQQQQHYKKSPPLLPLPITKPYASLPSRTRGLSCSPPNSKSNFNRSIKKSKPSSSSSSSSSSISPKKEDSKKESNSRNANTKDVSECLIIASTNRLGPDPNDLPKDVSMVLSTSSSSSSSSAAAAAAEVVDGVITCKVLVDLEKFSGSVFTLSPPPSSLPLPKFSLRPKLGCDAQADGFDAGATDNLRRLLRLR